MQGEQPLNATPVPVHRIKRACPPLNQLICGPHNQAPYLVLVLALTSRNIAPSAHYDYHLAIPTK